jgi:hypothetical protein
MPLESTPCKRMLHMRGGGGTTVDRKTGGNIPQRILPF